MNASAVAKQYGSLTPEERFRLILAASGRGDEQERDRLARAGQRITLSMPDHSPYAQAFNDLATLTFIELADASAVYFDAFARADEEKVEEGWKRPIGERTLDTALAAGFVLRTKADGWKLFCERMSVPPWLLWEEFPGFDRLQRALAGASRAAFTPEGMLRWANAVRPEGEPEVKTLGLTPGRIADNLETAFHSRARWWGGS